MDKYQAFIGKILDNRYKILELVGVGGMAFVLKAEDLVMNRMVAIKILNDQYNGDEQAEKRFINESKAVAMLSNKNVVSVYDVAIYPDIKYIVMEFLDGITLREYMDNKKVLPWKEACVYTLQILRALEHAHGKNVVHRDIKPQNIILLKDGEVKVTDFGIAKTPDMADVTLTDKAIGTVYYISPEQASGKETTYASDLYSVGVMLYEQVTGELPFTADSPVTIAMMQINEVPKNPSDINPEIPVGVSQIILKAMAKQPEDRFKDAHSMLKAVDYVIKNPDVVFSDGKKEGTDNQNGAETTAEGDAPADISEKSEEKDEKVDINMIATGEIGDYVVNINEGNSAEPKVLDKKQLRAAKRKERKQRRKENPSHSIFPVITGVFFAFMIVAFAVGGYLAVRWIPTLFKTEEPKDFFVRDLTDLEYNTDLREELEGQGYIVTVTEVYRQGLGFNVIVDQDPEMGNKRTSDGKCRINLMVNKYPDNLTVPDVKYMTASEAEKVLKQYNLYAVTEFVTDLYANDKQIVSTKPDIGSYIEPGATVTLYVCKGAEITEAKTMPNVVGDTIETAKKKLEDAYYRVTITTLNSDKPEGQVIAQDVPKYTTGLAAWTMVTLTVSHQTDMKIVENYFGLTLKEATDKLTAAGFTRGAVTYNASSYKAGTVIRQSVNPGLSAAVGTVIDLVISGEGEGIASPVPDVFGMNVDAAKTKLEKAGYSVSIIEQPSSGTVDQVLKQSLTAGKTGYPVGTKITLTVSVAEGSVLVDSCSGYTFPQALGYLAEHNLSLGTVTFTNNAEGSPAEYSVVGQTVGSGTYVAPGTAVGFTLYGESCNADAAPRTIGMTEAGAVTALHDAWYTVEVVYQDSRDSDGVVLDQSVLEGSTNNAPGTKVTITVSKLKTTVTVPDFTGKIYDEAVNEIYDLGLAIGTVDYEPSDLPDETVISQTPDANTEVPFDTVVNLVLSGDEPD